MAMEVESMPRDCASDDRILLAVASSQQKSAGEMDKETT
jgi:hypothetical protein